MKVNLGSVPSLSCQFYYVYEIVNIVCIIKEKAIT